MPFLTRTSPGSIHYYLKRLGRLELSGIPQITYEALTCNDNSNRIVQGIFKPNIKYLTDNPLVDTTPENTFSNSSFSFLHSYTAKSSPTATASTQTKYFTNMHGLQHEPVFSANDFKCCAQLGKTVNDEKKCCSGYGVGQTPTNVTCALPAGANLMVYFNRFVSNEGRGNEQPGGGLVDTDFDDQTGEPLVKAAVIDKIRALGLSYCASGGVRQGGAFGAFRVEPQGSQTNTSSTIYNIVDSVNDIAMSSNAGATEFSGYRAFADGFRWNHHLYCVEGP
jgi:hypothetical protein